MPIRHLILCLPNARAKRCGAVTQAKPDDADRRVRLSAQLDDTFQHSLLVVYDASVTFCFHLRGQELFSLFVHFKLARYFSA